MFYNIIDMHILSIFNSDEERILRSPSRLVTKKDFEDWTVARTISELQATLEHYGNGVWLSAVQIWYPLQIFVINCRPTESFPHMQTFSQVIINPIIKDLSAEKFDGREWCMSIADDQCNTTHRYQIRRSISVDFEYTNESNKVQTGNLSGIAAVVFQHEYDHLLGKLIDQTCLPGQVILQQEYLERKKNGEQMTL